MTDLKPLSLAAHTTYHDLKSLMLDEQIRDLRGTPVRREVSGRHYWYDHYRLGNQVKGRYLGEDTPDLRQRLERATHEGANRKARQKERSRLVRLLRAENMLGVDQSTGPLLRAFEGAGVFRVGGVLVGTHAFRLYEGELGFRLPAGQYVSTDDMDIAAFERLALAIGDEVDQSLGGVLADFNFDPVPELDRRSVWRWQQSTSNASVEFLTPSFEEDEGIRPLKSLNVHARALHHLNFLIAEPIQAVALYRDGVLVRIPRPERFAIHKLIVADRRQAGPDALKSRKDRAQAAFLIRVLAEDRPYELKDAWDTARAAGPKWRDRLDASLARMPEEKAILDGLA